MEHFWHSLCDNLSATLTAVIVEKQHQESSSSMLDMQTQFSPRNITEIRNEIMTLFEQVQLRSLSTYHTCAAIAEIACAGLKGAYPSNPFLSGIYSLASKEEQHGSEFSDLFATIDQLLSEMTQQDCPMDMDYTSWQRLHEVEYHLRMALHHAKAAVDNKRTLPDTIVV